MSKDKSIHDLGRSLDIVSLFARWAWFRHPGYEKCCHASHWLGCLRRGHAGIDAEHRARAIRFEGR